MIRIGLTGNAGSGKSVAAEFFRLRGIETISTDAINAKLRKTCQFLASLLEIILQTRITDESGTIDIIRLRNILFSSTSSRLRVEAVLHPLILENVDLQQSLLPTNDCCIIEIPLLHEANLRSLVDSVLLITADRKILIDRIRQRNHLGKADALSILDNQLADNTKYTTSDNIVFNNTDKQEFHNTLAHLYPQYS